MRRTVCSTLICATSTAFHAYASPPEPPAAHTAEAESDVTSRTPEYFADLIVKSVRLGHLSEQDGRWLFTILYCRLHYDDVLSFAGSMKSHVAEADEHREKYHRWQRQVLSPSNRGLWTDDDTDAAMSTLNLDTRQAAHVKRTAADVTKRYRWTVVTLLARVESIRLEGETAEAMRLLATFAPTLADAEFDDFNDLVTTSHQQQRREIFDGNWPVDRGDPGLQAFTTCSDIALAAEQRGGRDQLHTKLYRILLSTDNAIEQCETHLDWMLLELAGDESIKNARENLDRIFMDRRLTRDFVGGESLNVERALHLMATASTDAAQSDAFVAARRFVEENRPEVLRLLNLRDDARREEWRSIQRFGLLGRTDADREQMFDHADLAIEAGIALRDELHQQSVIVVGHLAGQSATLVDEFRSTCDLVAYPHRNGPERLKAHAGRLMALESATDEQRRHVAEAISDLEREGRRLRHEANAGYIAILNDAAQEYAWLPTTGDEVMFACNLRADDLVAAYDRKLTELFRKLEVPFSDEQREQACDLNRPRLGALVGRMLRPPSPTDRADKIWRRAMKKQ